MRIKESIFAPSKYSTIKKMASGYLLNFDTIETQKKGFAIATIQTKVSTEKDTCFLILYKMYNELKEYLPSKDVVEKEANEYRRTHGQASNT